MSKTVILSCCIIWLFKFQPGCASHRQISSAAPLQSTELLHRIHIVNHGKHAGIILLNQDVDPSLWPERQDFANAVYLEVGWGDKDYYQTPNPDFAVLLKAALLPTPGVLHIAAFNVTPTRFFSHSDIITVTLPRTGYNNLLRYIDNSFARNDNKRALPLTTGLYGDSFFYLSKENYHLFKTCNVWIAQALVVAGLPLKPILAVTADGLMSQIESLSTINNDKDQRQSQFTIDLLKQGADD